MAKYHRKLELEQWQAMSDSYQLQFLDWKSAHQTWEEEDLAEQDVEEPIAPDPHIDVLVEYEARMVETIEEIETPLGSILVTPGRIVMTGSDGQVFALNEDELERQFSLIKESV